MIFVLVFGCLRTQMTERKGTAMYWRVRDPPSGQLSSVTKVHIASATTEQAANTHSCCYVLNWRVVFWLSDLPIHSATSATLPKYGARGMRGVVGGACDAVYPRSHLTPGWATYSILHIWLINNVITILTLMTMTLDAAVSYFQNKVKEIHLKLLSTY